MRGQQGIRGRKRSRAIRPGEAPCLPRKPRHLASRGGVTSQRECRRLGPRGGRLRMCRKPTEAELLSLIGAAPESPLVRDRGSLHLFRATGLTVAVSVAVCPNTGGLGELVIAVRAGRLDQGVPAPTRTRPRQASRYSDRRGRSKLGGAVVDLDVVAHAHTPLPFHGRRRIQSRAAAPSGGRPRGEVPIGQNRPGQMAQSWWSGGLSLFVSATLIRAGAGRAHASRGAGDRR